VSAGDAAMSPHVLPAGTTLQGNSFVIRKLLGQGGFGITYLAEETKLGRLTALKEFFPENCVRQQLEVQPSGRLSDSDYQQARDRFLNEARVLARFQHPSIVNVFTFFEENNSAYLAMEFLKGQTLTQMVEGRGALPETEALRYIERVGEAIEAVHAQNLLHRDIKPDNVIVCDDGRVVLIDFGLHKEVQSNAGLSTRKFTNTSIFVTAGYAPPEQYGKQVAPGNYTDVYSLAATLYYLVTEQEPVDALDRLQGVPLPPAQSVNSAISRSVGDAIQQAMEVNVATRPQSVRAFLDSLRAPRPAPRTAAKSPASSSNKAPHAPVVKKANPYLPLVEKIIAELETPLVAPASAHTARLDAITTILDKLAKRPIGTMACPGCHAANLVQVTGQPTGKCPQCRTGRLLKRSLDLDRCAVCRNGHLTKHEFAGVFCPICRTARLVEESRKRYMGLAADIWLTCPACAAEWDVLGNDTARLMSFHEDPYGMGAMTRDRTLLLSEWHALSTRKATYYECGDCAAQWDEEEDQRLTLTQYADDPYGVGREYSQKTLFRAAWAKLAADLPIGAGNVYCSDCQAEFNFEKSNNSLTLLKGDAPVVLPSSLRGQVPIQNWYLHLAGKSSLHPGWLCPGCQTEFDLEGAGLKLVRTDATALKASINRMFSVDDWQRVARQLPTSDEENRLRAEATKLNQAMKREQEELRKTWQKRHDKLTDEFNELFKKSFLEGFIPPPADDAGPAIDVSEYVRWRSPAKLLNNVTVNGLNYWTEDLSGILYVTNQRLCLIHENVVMWWQPIARIEMTNAITWRLRTVLAVKFLGTQRPIGLAVEDARIEGELGGRRHTLVLSHQDLLQLLGPAGA